MTSATRSLCVGAYFDPKFRSRVLREVYFEIKRALAPSYGFDAVTVLLHCRRARDWAVARDILLCGCLALALVTGFLNFVGVVLLLILWAIVVRLAWVARIVFGPQDRQISPRVRAVLGCAGLFVLLVWFLDVILPAVIEALAELQFQLAESGIAADYWFGLGLVDYPPSNNWIALVLLLMAAAVGMEAFARQRALEALASNRPWRVLRRHRLGVFSERQRGNVTMYSGFSPFIGAGEELRTWSFALRLVRATPGQWFGQAEAPGNEYAELPFGVHELIAHLRDQLGALTIESEPRLSLPGLSIRDHVFQAAAGAPGLTHLMSPAQVGTVIADPTRSARHYLCCQVRSWDGEVVTTVFVHVALQGRTLYLEFSAWLLPPVRAEYQVLGDPRSTRPGARFDAVGRSLVELPRLVARAPLGVLRAARDVVRAVLTVVLRVAPADYDFGARTSIRELGAMSPPDTKKKKKKKDRDDDDYIPDNYFASRDVVKYWKILERRLIATTFDFLQSHEVDTAEYSQRAVTVLNTGVMQFGGRMDIRNSPIGGGGPR